MAWMILVGYISKNLSAHTHTRWIGHTSHISYLTCWPLWLRVTTSLRWGFLNVFLLGFFMAHLSYGFFPVYGTLDSAVDRWYGRRVWAIQNLGIWVLETRYPKTHGRSSPIINFLIKSQICGIHHFRSNPYGSMQSRNMTCHWKSTWNHSVSKVRCLITAQTTSPCIGCPSFHSDDLPGLLVIDCACVTLETVWPRSTDTSAVPWTQFFTYFQRLIDLGVHPHVHCLSAWNCGLNCS